MKEIWRDVPNYEGLYQISNNGKVRSLNYNRTKKQKELKLIMLREILFCYIIQKQS
jgi:hypothetical protein